MFPNQMKPPGSAKSPSQMMGFTKLARNPAVIGMAHDPSIPGLPANVPPPPAVNVGAPIGKLRNPIRTKGISPIGSKVPPRL